MTSEYMSTSEFLYSTGWCCWWSTEVEEEDEAIRTGKVKLLLNLFSSFLALSGWPSKLKNSLGFAPPPLCIFETSEFWFWSGLFSRLSGLNNSLASSERPVRALKKDSPFGHLMSFSCSLTISSIRFSDEWGRRNMCSSLACGNPSLPEFEKLGEESIEVADGSGLCPQLKSWAGGRIGGMGDCFEGSEEAEEVFLVEEKSWER